MIICLLVCGKFMPYNIFVCYFVLILSYVMVQHCEYNHFLTDTVMYNREYPSHLGGITQGLVLKVAKLSSLPFLIEKQKCKNNSLSLYLCF